MNWTTSIFLGIRKSDNSEVYISAPSWDCDWYWGFGYLRATGEHYHLSSYINGQSSLYDTLTHEFDLNPDILKNIWVFCELVETAYTLRTVAEVYYSGGSNCCSNSPCADLIKNPTEYERINKVLLPEIFNQIYVCAVHL